MGGKKSQWARFETFHIQQIDLLSQNLLTQNLRQHVKVQRGTICKKQTKV